MIELLPIVGSILTMLLGLMGLLSPASAAKFTSIKPDGLVGVSEIRATYGGFFLGVGGAALFFQNHYLYLGLGVAWISAAVGRIISVIVDKSSSAKNLGGIIFELFIGVLLIAAL